MMKAAWAEVAATCVRNCFRKAGFVDTVSNAKPDVSEDDQPGEDLWQRVVDSDMWGHDTGWNDFISVDGDAYTAELCTDEGIVSEVRGDSDTEESDEDETSEPAPISVPVGMGYIESLRQLVYAKGLGEEHASALNKLETSLIGSALQKQTSITDFFAKKKFCVLTSTCL
ncbi:hypothetical protein V5799_032204 [Amblyomma americanum]|uniref:Uncharacterized protein n=1 Tax=Amblyomma americanum TaxID=6943 RepID=A0AAQ4DRU7_AMBAM